MSARIDTLEAAGKSFQHFIERHSEQVEHQQTVAQQPLDWPTSIQQKTVVLQLFIWLTKAESSALLGGEWGGVRMWTASGRSQENQKDWFDAILLWLSTDGSLKVRREVCTNGSLGTRCNVREKKLFSKDFEVRIKMVSLVWEFWFWRINKSIFTWISNFQ